MNRTWMTAAAAWLAMACVDGTTTKTDTESGTTGDSGTTEVLTVTGDWSGPCEVVVPKEQQGKGLKDRVDLDLAMTLTDDEGAVTGTGTAEFRLFGKPDPKATTKEEPAKVRMFDLTISGTFDGSDVALTVVPSVKKKTKDVTLDYVATLDGDSLDGSLSNASEKSGDFEYGCMLTR